jgi:hypothetical protein
MSRPLKYDSKMIDNICQQFKEQLMSSPIESDTKTINFNLDTNNKRAKLYFSPKAWIKMSTLVDGFSTEVEWHGLVSRMSKNSFYIEDILIFKHVATGSTVVTEQDEYNKFLDSLPDDVFNKMKMHGHSHVNMACSPSGVDMQYRKDVVSNSGKPTNKYDVFQIFLITNKRAEFEAQIYDITNNILYDKGDIDIDILFAKDETSTSFLEEAKKLVTPPPAPAVTAVKTIGQALNKGSKTVEHCKTSSKYGKSQNYYDNFYGNDDLDYYGKGYEDF